MADFICVFTIIKYGFSGNELPPPIVKTISRAVFSNEGEEILDFIARCNNEGITVRTFLSQEKAVPYSQQDGCDWKVFIIGTTEELLEKRKEV